MVDFSSAIFVDECGFTLSKKRSRGRALLGRRVYSINSVRRIPNFTVFAGVSCREGLVFHAGWSGGTKALTFIEALGKMFAQLRVAEVAFYVAQHPGTAEEDVPHVSRLIVMDNASFHKTAAVRKFIHDAGYEVMYLPPYSPFLSPIEECFAMWKARVNTQLCAPQNTKSILECIGEAAACVEHDRVSSFYRHCQLFVPACFQHKPIGAEVLPPDELETFEVTWKYSEMKAAAYYAVHPRRVRGRPQCLHCRVVQDRLSRHPDKDHRKPKRMIMKLCTLRRRSETSCIAKFEVLKAERLRQVCKSAWRSEASLQ